MDEDSDEELEEIDERMQSSSSSEDEDNTEKTELMFRTRRAKDSSNVFDFTWPPSGVNRSVAPDINAESSPLSIFMLFCRQIFQLLLEETNRYFHQKHSKHFSTITWHYDRRNIHIFRNYNSNGTLPVWQPQRLLVQRGSVLYSILFKCDGAQPFFPHSMIPPFWRQWQPSKPWWPRLRETLENKKDFWHSEQQILWNVQSNWTPCCGWNHRVV